jgi:hypothetical protein
MYAARVNGEWHRLTDDGRAECGAPIPKVCEISDIALLWSAKHLWCSLCVALSKADRVTAELTRVDSRTGKRKPRSPGVVPLKEHPAITLRRYIRQQLDEDAEEFEFVQFDDVELFKLLRNH